jgi:hypothetical protein
LKSESRAQSLVVEDVREMRTTLEGHRRKRNIRTRTGRNFCWPHAGRTRAEHFSIPKECHACHQTLLLRNPLHFCGPHKFACPFRWVKFSLPSTIKMAGWSFWR